MSGATLQGGGHHIDSNISLSENGDIILTSVDKKLPNGSKLS